ncbi:hypothetical protein [Salinarchaeum chitinilyticum]
MIDFARDVPRYDCPSTTNDDFPGIAVSENHRGERTVRRQGVAAPDGSRSGPPER